MNNVFSRRVREAMQRNNVTFSELQQRTGMNETTLEKICTGYVQTPRMTSARAISKALCVPMDWLYGQEA